MHPLLPSRPLGKQVTRSREVLLLNSVPLSSPERAGDAATCGTFVYALFVQRLGQSLAGKIILLSLFTSGLENSLLPVSVGVWRRGAKVGGGCVWPRWPTPSEMGDSTSGACHGCSLIADEKPKSRGRISTSAAPVQL